MTIDDSADEIAREIVGRATTLAAPDVCILGHDRSALIAAIAAALRAYGASQRNAGLEEATQKLSVVWADTLPSEAAEIVRSFKTEALKSTPESKP